jgi:hypothetical protein
MKPHQDGYVLAGEGESGRMLLFKVHRDGAVEWQQSYDFTPLEWAFSVDGLAVAPNDDLVVAASYGLPPHAHVLRMDSRGGVLWNRFYPRDYSEARGVVFDGGALVLTWDGNQPLEQGIIRLERNGAVTNRTVKVASFPRSSPDGSVYVAGGLPYMGTAEMTVAKVSGAGPGCGVVQDAELLAAPLPPVTDATYQTSRSRVSLRDFDLLPEPLEPTVSSFCP